MSLISALHTSFIGIRNTESHLNAASSNITNSDKTGYTRKVYEDDYVTTSSGTVPAGGTLVTADYDQYLYKSMVEDASDSGYYEVISDYLSNYSSRLGDPDGDSTLSSALDDLAAAFDALTQTPEDSSLKSEVIRNAELLTYEVRDLSSSVQSLRLQADSDIEAATTDINKSLSTLESLNEKISLAQAKGESTADFEDERRVELENISSYLNIDYFVDGNNQLKIYTGGRALLDSKAHTLDYTAASTVNGSVTYPGGFSAISLDGVDITTSITNGKLGGLIELRDTTLVQEQDKLDAFATSLMDKMNAIHNESASLPGKSQMTGSTSGLAGGLVSGATGSVRIATIDEDGTILSVADIDLSATTTIDDIVSAINAALGPDVTASLTSDGDFQITSNNSGAGLVLNPLDSDIGGESFSSYFGLNDLFTGTGAADLYVAEDLRDNPDYLGTAQLSDTASSGEAGIAAGDGSLAEEMQDAFSSNMSFAAAGGFSAGSFSLSSYANKITAAIASQADQADGEYSSVSAVYAQTKTSLQNLSGVNIDEEMTRIVELQSKYEAAATLVATIQDLFSELIAAVR